jgi:hypothetical protein
MIDKKHYIEKITLQDFKKIVWNFKYPHFIIEVVKYTTGLRIDEYLKHLKVETEQSQIDNKMKIIE